LLTRKNKEDWEEPDGRVIHLNMSVTDPKLQEIIEKHKTNVVAHFAWWFNPTHDTKSQRHLDIDGTNNVLNASAFSEVVDHIVYVGSTTCYGQLPENDHALKEEEWEENMVKRLRARYTYSRHKAEVDLKFQNFKSGFYSINVFWVRAAIVLGPNTNNVVSYMAKSFGKYMFSVKGYDPDMQFVSEFDMAQILYRATVERWSGVVNVAGQGTIKYSKMIELLGRKNFSLPWWVIYPFCWLVWNIRIGDKSLLKFPPELIYLIRYPWVGDITKLKEVYKYEPYYSSVEAVLQFAKTL